MRSTFLLVLVLTWCFVAQQTFAKHNDNTKEEKEKTADDEDKAGRIVSDCVEKVKCENTLLNVQKCMRAAKDAGLTPSADEVSKEFSTCAKEKLLKKAAEAASGESEFGPNRDMANLTVRLEDDFLQSRNATDLNLKLWKASQKNEERSVSQMDSVGIKLMNWRYQQTTPDLSIKLKQNMDCAGSHKNDTASKQRNVHACQEWCKSKGNEDFDLPEKHRRYNATRSGCEFQGTTGKENCFLRVSCEARGKRLTGERTLVLSIQSTTWAHTSGALSLETETASSSLAIATTSPVKVCPWTRVVTERLCPSL